MDEDGDGLPGLTLIAAIALSGLLYIVGLIRAAVWLVMGF